jgi:predicted nucleic acid-binding protein
LSSILLDTNVLVYAFDAGDPGKQTDAQRLLKTVQPTGVAALSAQVLAEFFRVVTSKLQPAVPVADAVKLVGDLAQSFSVWSIEDIVVLEAARGVRDHQLSYWDAQIWATARLRGARLVLSEDFTNGVTIEGISFRDPFQAGFSVEKLNI